MGGGARRAPRGSRFGGPDALSGVDGGAGWYADPSGRHQYRWYDGQQWTDQASDKGQPVHSPFDASAWSVADVRTVVSQAGVARTFEGRGHALAEPIVVVDPTGGLHAWTGARLGALQAGPHRPEIEARLLPTARDRIVDRVEAVDATGASMLRMVIARGPGGPVGADHFRALASDPWDQDVAWIQGEGPMDQQRSAVWIGGADRARIQPVDPQAATFVVAELGGAQVGWFTHVHNPSGAGRAAVLQVHQPLESPWDRMLLAAVLAVDRGAGAPERSR